MKILHSESDKKKNSKNDLNKIETSFVKGEQKMNGLEKKNGKMLNGKVMDIEKVNESSF